MADPVTAATVFWDLKATDLLKFLSELVSAVAWPAAATFIVSFFRKEIIERIPRLSELTLPGGISAKFNQVLSQVEAEVAEKEHGPHDVPTSIDSDREPQGNTEGDITPPLPSGSGQPPLDESVEEAGTTSGPAPTLPGDAWTDLIRNYSLSGTSFTDPIALHANPTGTVMVSWHMLEQALRAYGETLNRSNILETFTPSQLIKFLANNNLLDANEVITLVDLIELRNLAAHSSSKTISDTEAKRFSEVTYKLAREYRTRAIQLRLDDQQREARKRLHGRDW